jgi:hypothetical protein
VLTGGMAKSGNGELTSCYHCAGLGSIPMGLQVRPSGTQTESPVEKRGEEACVYPSVPIRILPQLGTSSRRLPEAKGTCMGESLGDLRLVEGASGGSDNV